jgi:hypothetical protein
MTKPSASTPSQNVGQRLPASCCWPTWIAARSNRGRNRRARVRLDQTASGTYSQLDYRSDSSLKHLARPGHGGPIVSAREDDTEKQFINPPQLYKHPAYSRVVTVKGPCKFIFIAGQTPSGDNYEPMAKGDYKKQYDRVIEG